ncbi:hypothetical protein OPV22_034772 [Ensete ventricosum]|uniref:Uncharacterized protein n=1 Tax=Ensete ventricosum TaxID=4639 RepID=A0AAV8PRI5_ENSVE|nr:hypothetical protein OPV22_034772 [Ensete ventricosum]
MRKCRRQPRAAAGIASARPVAKCRCERCCSRHCECPSRRQVQMCRIQARAQISSADVSHELQQALREWPSRPQVQMRALLQQAALRVAVPSPSADVQNSAASAAAAGSIARKVPPVASFALRRSPLARAAENGQFWPVFGPFSVLRWARERSSGRGIGVAGKVLPFASFAVRRSPLARAAKNGQFWPVFGPFSRAAAIVASGAKRQPSQHPGTPRVAQGWMGLSYSREGAARRFVRSPPLAARSGGPKRPVLACFWAVFVCCGGRGERSSGRGIRVAGKVLPFASFAVRRSPLARAAKNGQFWPVFGPFSRAAATVASGAKRQPFQHPGTPRVAQGWMGLSYSREGAARRFVRSPPLAARSGGRKRPVLACFWAVFACCGGRVSGRLDVALV